MSKKITTKKNTIIFDIDSSSIGAALVQYGYTVNKKNISTIELCSVRKNITGGNKYSFEEFFKRTARTLDEVAQEIYLQSLVPLDEIVINVAVPWSSSQKRNLVYSSKKAFLFTHELSTKLIHQDSELSFDINIDYAGHDVELIQRKNLEVYGNGYPMRNPIGKEVSDIEIHFLTSVMSSGTKNIFTDIIERVFHRTPRFISNTFVQYQELRVLLPHVDNAVIVDISGEVTEMIVVKEDNLLHIGSIPVGTQGIIRHLSDELHISPAKARTLVDLYKNTGLGVESKETQNAIKKSFRYWFREFYTLLDDYSKQGLLPHVLIVNAHNEVRSWFEELLMAEDSLREHMHTQGRIELLHIPIRSSDANTTHAFLDPALGIIAAYIEQETK
ncbi:MAG: hypothetical protein ACI870_000073 [Crocinitomicaceae bacterium]|jgi:hypothetical protein